MNIVFDLLEATVGRAASPEASELYLNISVKNCELAAENPSLLKS